MDKSGFALGGLWQSLCTRWRRQDEAAMLASLETRLRADIGLEPRQARGARVPQLVFCWVR